MDATQSGKWRGEPLAELPAAAAECCGNRRRCFLCREITSLQRGHVIPRFVSRYLKRTSAKPGHVRLRQGHDGHLVQDGPTHHMFCRACEQLLSRDEQAFSRYVFGYAYALSSEAIAYEEWLLRFACGLMLRVCVANLYFSGDDKYVVEPLSARHRRLLEGACEDFRNYLLGDSDWPGKLQPLRISVGLTEIPRDGVIRSLWDFYMTRGFDSGIVTGDIVLAVYAHLPFHVFWAGVAPKKVRASDWKNCRITKRGVLDPNTRQYAPDAFWEYMDWRLRVMAPGFVAGHQALAG